ncbi:hypothetical protein Droror1_Dr00017443 [Drosera rotundifolia]
MVKRPTNPSRASSHPITLLLCFTRMINLPNNQFMQVIIASYTHKHIPQSTIEFIGTTLIRISRDFLSIFFLRYSMGPSKSSLQPNPTIRATIQPSRYSLIQVFDQAARQKDEQQPASPITGKNQTIAESKARKP